MRQIVLVVIGWLPRWRAWSGRCRAWATWGASFMSGNDRVGGHRPDRVLVGLVRSRSGCAAAWPRALITACHKAARYKAIHNQSFVILAFGRTGRSVAIF